MADEEQKVVKASVRVTLVLNPSDFFAQVGTDEQLAVFDEFCSELSSWCDQHNEHGVTASLPHLGNYVAVRCGHSTSTVAGGGGAWIRGMVTNHIDSNEIECSMLDTGATLRVMLADICSRTPPMITTVAAQALHCSLVDVRKPTGVDGWPARSISRFQQLVSLGGTKRAVVYSNDGNLWPLSIVLKVGEHWTPVARLLAEEQLANYVPMWHVLQEVDMLNPNPIHSFPAHQYIGQRDKPAVLPEVVDLSLPNKHSDNQGDGNMSTHASPVQHRADQPTPSFGKMGIASSADVTETEKMLQDRKVEGGSHKNMNGDALDSADDDDDWDITLLPPVSNTSFGSNNSSSQTTPSKNYAKGQKRYPKKANLQACYSALMSDGKPNDDIPPAPYPHSPHQRVHPRGGSWSNKPFSRRPPVENSFPQKFGDGHQEPLLQLPLHGGRGRGAAVRRGGGRAGEQGRRYGRGSARECGGRNDWRDKKYVEQNSHLRQQFGGPSMPPLPFPPPPPPPPPPPFSSLPPLPPSPKEGGPWGEPRGPKILGMTGQNLKNEVDWLSWKIEKDMKKILAQPASSAFTDKELTGEIHKLLTSPNALKLFNLAGANAPFQAVLRALVCQLLAKPSLLNIVMGCVQRLYEYSASAVSCCLQPVLEEATDNLDEEKNSVFCSLLGKLYLSTFPPAEAILKHFLNSWVRCSPETSLASTKLFALFCEEFGPVIDASNREILDVYFESTIKDSILEGPLPRSSKEVLLDVAMKRAVWIHTARNSVVDNGCAANGNSDKKAKIPDKISSPALPHSSSSSSQPLPTEPLPSTPPEHLSNHLPPHPVATVSAHVQSPANIRPPLPQSQPPPPRATHLASLPNHPFLPPRPCPTVQPPPPPPNTTCLSQALVHSSAQTTTSVGPAQMQYALSTSNQPLQSYKWSPPLSTTQIQTNSLPSHSSHPVHHNQYPSPHPTQQQKSAERVHVAGLSHSLPHMQPSVIVPTFQPARPPPPPSTPPLPPPPPPPSTPPLPPPPHSTGTAVIHSQHNYTTAAVGFTEPLVSSTKATVGVVSPSSMSFPDQQTTALAIDPYRKVMEMLRELDLSTLIDKFRSSMIKDQQLKASRNDLKSALKEAGIPSGAVLAITQYLDSQLQPSNVPLPPDSPDSHASPLVPLQSHQVPQFGHQDTQPQQQQHSAVHHHQQPQATRSYEQQFPVASPYTPGTAGSLPPPPTAAVVAANQPHPQAPVYQFPDPAAQHKYGMKTQHRLQIESAPRVHSQTSDTNTNSSFSHPPASHQLAVNTWSNYQTSWSPTMVLSHAQQQDTGANNQLLQQQARSLSIPLPGAAASRPTSNGPAIPLHDSVSCGPPSVPLTGPPSMPPAGPPNMPPAIPRSMPLAGPPSMPPAGPPNMPPTGPPSMPLAGPPSVSLAGPPSVPLAGPPSVPLAGPPTVPLDGPPGVASPSAALIVSTNCVQQSGGTLHCQPSSSSLCDSQKTVQPPSNQQFYNGARPPGPWPPLPPATFGSKGIICSLCGSCAHRSSYCPKRNELLFNSHVDD